MDCKASTQSVRKNLKCLITLKPIKRPAFVPDDGFTYEWNEIYKWVVVMGKSMTPMRFPLTRGVLILNRAVERYASTQITFKDPIIIEENGETYEHEELVRAIKQTICRYKPIILEGANYRTISCHPNKILWKDQYCNERKPLVMPPQKVYAGISHDVVWLRLHETGSSIGIGDLLRCFVSNMLFEQIEIQEIDVKEEEAEEEPVKMINCKFSQCVFRDVDLVGRFKNCEFETCYFVGTAFGNFECPGTSFNSCIFVGSVSVQLLMDRGGIVTKEMLFDQTRLSQVLELSVPDLIKNLTTVPPIKTPIRADDAMKMSIANSIRALISGPQPDAGCDWIREIGLPFVVHYYVMHLCSDTTVHSAHLITYRELLWYVWQRIKNSRFKAEMVRILQEQIADSEGKCLDGQFNRLVSVLVGYCDDVVIGTSDISNISSFIIKTGARIDPYDPAAHRSLARCGLLERGYDESEISPWLDAIDD